MLLLRAKADVASFDHGMLSVSWGAQFSVFSFLVNYIFCYSACLRSATEFKCGKNLIYVRDVVGYERKVRAKERKGI